MQFVPLLLKVGAINKISHQSVNFRRVDFKLKNLKLAVFLVVLIVIIYLSLWTVIDPNTSKLNEILVDQERGIVST